MHGCADPCLVYGFNFGDRNSKFDEDWLYENYPGIECYAADIVRNYLGEPIYGVACYFDNVNGKAITPSEEEQETVKLYINEKSFFTTSDVLKLISEALSAKNETLEERVIRMMPENTKAIWNQLNESAKKSILSQARLYPSEMLTTESQVEHFWATRNLKTNESVTKKLVSHDALIQEDKLSDNEVNAIMERFKNI